MAKCLIPALAFVFFGYAGTAALALQDFEQQISGKWRVNVAKTRTYLKFGELSTDADDDFLKEVGKLSVEFGSEHSVIVHEAENEQMKGHWELIKDEDGRIEIDLIREEEDEATRATIEFLDQNSVAIAIKNERPFVFSREEKLAVEGIAGKLIGTWECDRNATENLESNKKFSQEQLDKMMQEAGGMTVSFNKDGSFAATTIAGEEILELKGAWKSSNVDEEKKTFDLSLEAERGPDSLNVEFRDDGSVRFSPPDQPSAVFVRKFEKSEKLPKT